MKHQTHQGFVLVTSLIFLIVLSLLGVMAMRGSLFEERMASNDRDLTLAREYAELALRDAERDILGLRFDGTSCAAVSVVCATERPAGTRPNPDNPLDGSFWSNLNIVEEISSATGGLGEAIARQGVYNRDAITACGMPIWSGADWADGNATRQCAGTIGAAVPTVPYGTFTDAPFNGPPGAVRPRYLIEVLRAADFADENSLKLFFRITAVGFGRTQGASGRTSVTLQSVFSPNSP
jgi:type IV pilus assembly protein PilX